MALSGGQNTIVWVGLQVNTGAASAAASASLIADKVAVATGRRDKNRVLSDLENLIHEIGANIIDGKTLIRVEQTGVTATGSINATAGQPANNDTFTIAGVVFTFKTNANPSTPSEIQIGASNTATMATLLAAFLAHPLIGNLFQPTLAAAVITMKAAFPGTWGNALTLVKSGANLAVSGATLTTGTDVAPSVGAALVTGGLV